MVIRTIKNNAIKLDIYNGLYSIVSGWVKDDGTFKPNWAEMEVFDKTSKTRIKKILPVKIPLGRGESAKEILEALLSGIESVELMEDAGMAPRQPGDEDITPF